jgi:hypothetical protein
MFVVRKDIVTYYGTDNISSWMWIENLVFSILFIFMISIIKLLHLMFNFEALKLYIGKTYL